MYSLFLLLTCMFVFVLKRDVKHQLTKCMFVTCYIKYHQSISNKKRRQAYIEPRTEGSKHMLVVLSLALVLTYDYRQPQCREIQWIDLHSLHVLPFA